MMQDRLENPWRGTGLGLDAPWPIAEATDVIALLEALSRPRADAAKRRTGPGPSLWGGAREPQG